MMNFVNEYIKFPLYILTHPIKGFDELKSKNKKSLIVGTVFVLLTCLASIFSYKYTGIIVNMKNQAQFNSIVLIISIVLPVGLVSIANWSVTTLIDGKATLINIYKVISYSLFPYFICVFASIVLSQFITADEAAFYYMLNFIGIFLMVFMVFMGLLVTQEFGVFKMVLSILLTLVAICIILFVMLVIFDLSQQIYGFFYSIYREVLFRIGTRIFIC